MLKHDKGVEFQIGEINFGALLLHFRMLSHHEPTDL